MKDNLDKARNIFKKAEADGRSFLLEPEVYALLKLFGFRVPAHVFLPAGKKLQVEQLKKISSGKAVVKVVSPLIQHKSEVGGVAIVKNSVREIDLAIKNMKKQVEAAVLPLTGDKDISQAEVEASIKGFLIVELVDYLQVGFGSEILLGLRATNDFGPVVTFGGGGLDVEYLNVHIKPGRSLAILPSLPLSRQAIKAALEKTAIYGKVAEEFRGRKPLIQPELLIQAVQIFQSIGRGFSLFNQKEMYTIEELEVNPLVMAAGKLVPLDGLCRFSRRKIALSTRPAEQIEKILDPETIGLIGVSEKMNTGHIILNNLLKNGFPAEKIYVVKPGAQSIEGCRCVPSVAEMPVTVDLFIHSLGAEQVYPVMKDLVELEKAYSVIIIAGGLGEKAGTEELEANLRNLLKQKRREGKIVPVVNGGNCLGIISAPGKYDSIFIPDYKLKRPVGVKAGLAMISQSGAFMLSRMSNEGRLEPVYAVSIGNQLDLTAGDYLQYLKGRPEAKIIALYLEGLQPGDGLNLLRAARKALQLGQKIVVYKAGRSPEGRKATSSHTAAVAGDYAVASSLMSQAGMIITETIDEFENLIKGLAYLADKKVRGNRVGLMTNAGFESVIMADNLRGENGGLVLPEFCDQTVRKINQALSPAGIDRLLDIHNPLDVTPMADDATFGACLEALVEDKNVDCAVISIVPVTAVLQTLPPGEAHHENIYDENSLAGYLIRAFKKTDKPMVVNIDAGQLYDPLAEYLEDNGLPVFRRCDRALAFLKRFVAIHKA
ncbi:MAG: acetate--CoA ligase family protein [Candidatus Saccharicenans sp.]|nr:acetate--CoA ligase family protein [Candidatus Saccharicenans sp.]